MRTGKPMSRKFKKAAKARKRARVYRMTISSTWYDRRTRKAKEFELHYRVARHGKIARIRRHLARRCAVHFQQSAYRIFKRWIPKRKVKIRFERESPALKTQQLIRIEARRMEYRGKQWNAYLLPSRTLSYVKRRRRRRK
mgnify:CR=1 FL=1